MISNSFFHVSPQLFHLDLGFFKYTSCNTMDIEGCGRFWGATQWRLNLPGGLVAEGNYPQQYMPDECL